MGLEDPEGHWFTRVSEIKIFPMKQPILLQMLFLQFHLLLFNHLRSFPIHKCPFFFSVAATPRLIVSLLCQWFDAYCTSALLSISSPDLQRQRHIIGSSKWMRKGLLTQSHTFLLLWVFLQDCHRHLTAGCEDTLEDITMPLSWPIPVRF